MWLRLEDVADFARGAAFLGAGGGGDPRIGRLMLEAAIAANGPVELMPLQGVSDEGWFVTAAMMGAPSVLVERLPNGHEAETALKAVEDALGARMTGIIPAEIGGLNALLPVILGVRLGLPVVDADGMGRAFPEMQMVTYDFSGQSASPLAICDDVGNCVTIRAVDNVTAERLARQTIVAMGAVAQICSYPMRGAQAKQSAVAGTLSVAIAIGREIRLARESGRSPIQALLDFLPTTDYYRHSKLLFEGKIVSLSRNVDAGFTIGAVTLEDSSSARIDIEFRNEFIVARADGRTIAIVPDLIVLLDRENGEPITVEGLKYGQRISVLAVSAPPALRTARALEVVGPRCFRIDEDFQPLETIA